MLLASKMMSPFLPLVLPSEKGGRGTEFYTSPYTLPRNSQAGPASQSLCHFPPPPFAAPPCAACQSPLSLMHKAGYTSLVVGLICWAVSLLCCSPTAEAYRRFSCFFEGKNVKRGARDMAAFERRGSLGKVVGDVSIKLDGTSLSTTAAFR